MLGDFLQSPAGQIMDRRLQGVSNLLAPTGLEEMTAELHASREPEKEELTGGYPRPPGAGEDFDEKCTRCGDCQVACPNGTLFVMDQHSGPMLDPNYVPCLLCEDYPCIQACEDDALKPLAKNVLPKFGQAALITKHCLNDSFNRERRKEEGAIKRLPYCRQCLENCPVPGVLKLDREKMPTFADFCTGCGLCVEACPTLPKAIRIQTE